MISEDRLKAVGCTHTAECALRFAFPPSRCFFADGKQPGGSRQRPKPATGGPAFCELVPVHIDYHEVRDGKLDHYLQIIDLLGADKPATLAAFRMELGLAANTYRDGLVQATLAISRATDRAVNLQAWKQAHALLGALDALARADLECVADLLTGCAPIPSRVPTMSMLNPLGLIAGLADDSRQPTALRRCGQLAAELADTVRVINGRSTTSIGLWMATRDRPRRPANGPVASFQCDLRSLADEADAAASFYAQQKGPGANAVLHLFVEGVDEAVARYRGAPLSHVAGRDGRHSGQPESTDDKFIVGLIERIHATVPRCIVALAPQLFRPSAALDALKERIEARNKLQSKEMTGAAPSN